MNRILLLIEHRENSRLLAEWLRSRYQVIMPDWTAETVSESLLDQPFDLCIIGARTLDQLWHQVQARRTAEQPVLLPFLLTTSRQDVKYVTRHLWQTVDELITQPIEKVELQARVEILLRSRLLSQRLEACKSETKTQITARQQAEMGREQAVLAQRDSDDQFRQMAQTIPSVFWLFDLAAQRPIYISPAYEQIWGRSREEVYANFSVWFETIHLDDRVQMQAANVRCLTLGNSDEEYRILRPDGSIRWIRDRGFVVRDADGQPIRLAGVAEDVTDRKRIEAERKEILQREQMARETAERANQIKDEFLAVLSHELRTPMSPILGWANLLQKGNLDVARTTQALATIERNAKLQVQLIDDLLDISRILQGKLTLNKFPVHLSFVISAAIETVHLAIDAKAIHINLQLDPEVQPVLGDSARLQQVVWNLLSNAVKFTPRNGQIMVALTQVAHQAQIQVRDSGKGIHPDFLPHVFEHFRQEDGATTRKFGGLGLGLSIARQIVELHGGTIRVDSPGEGQGATFTVGIPLATQPELTLDSAPSPQSTVDLDGAQILVVDDDADSREFIAFMLQQQGAIVTIATSGASALEILTQSSPDLIISDIGMPDMDGYTLMSHIRQMAAPQDRQIPARGYAGPIGIALTAYASKADEERAYSVGFQRYIVKPIEPIAGIAIVSELLQEVRNR